MSRILWVLIVGIQVALAGLNLWFVAYGSDWLRPMSIAALGANAVGVGVLWRARRHFA